MIFSGHSLVLGAGEVGKSLAEVLGSHYPTYIADVNPPYYEDVDVLHICFPYFHGFEDAVISYQGIYKPALTIIHATVPVGTSRKVDAVHSPIHGKHPKLSEGIRTFTKYVGAVDLQTAALAETYLSSAGITTKIVSSPEVSELSKILCTTYYGWNILFNKEVKRICDELGVSFDEVYGWNKHYNEGYEKLGMDYFRRPVLEYSDGKIGGHCVVPNCRLLDSYITKLIKEKDETY